MSSISENFFENNIFRYDNLPCDCQEDISHVAPGSAPLRTLKCQAIETHPIRFAFAGETGLLRLLDNGAVAESNILAKLISLPAYDTDALLDFFSKNGFLFPVSKETYESIDAGTLHEIVNRIKATVNLLSALGSIRKNYRDILHMTMYLLLSDPVTISTESGTQYTTCCHPFLQKIKNAAYSQTRERQREAADGESFSVSDMVYPPSYDFSTDEYADIMSGDSDVSGASTWLYKNLANMYCNGTAEDSDTRMICDFLFHYEHEVGAVSSFKFGESLKYYGTPDPSGFTSEMKDALMKVAKLVISEEINSNLAGIRPQYDITRMSPSWKMDSLLSAIYFSIFYMKPGLELYRKCANPNCGNYFLVKSTSTRNKYCSPECCNRMSQSMYRKRKREKELAGK